MLPIQATKNYFPDVWSHVMNRDRRGNAIFTAAKDHVTFLALPKKIVKEYSVKVTAYCLMPTHYHLLAQTAHSNISRAMRRLRDDTLNGVSEVLESVKIVRSAVVFIE